MKNYVCLFLPIFVLFGLSTTEAVGFQEVRSAEYAVIEKCWGEIIIGAVDGSDHRDTTTPCENAPENMIDPNDIKQESVTLDGQTYTFTLNPYYMEGATGGELSAYMILTDNWNGFIQGVLNNIQKYKRVKVNEKWKTVEDEYATAKARDDAYNTFKAFVDRVKAQYSSIEVVYKPVYARDDLLGDIENTVFATKGNELIAIETNEDKNVFYAGNGVNIEEVGDTKIYTADNYFYLCEDNSKCDDCDALVAYGAWKGAKYFSRYCKNCACFFVWDAYVDPTNSIQQEGLKCIRKTVNGNYCGTHKCMACNLGIVGVSRVGEPFNDIRVTGNAYLANYSNYCVGHKCRAVMCRTIRGGNDTTASDPLDETELRSPLYCGAHNKGCHYMIGNKICGASVTNKSYENAGFRMLCAEHSKMAKAYAESPNGAQPQLTRCVCCGGVDVTYLYNKTAEGEIRGLCSPCLNAEWVNEIMNDADIALAIREKMKQNSRDSGTQVLDLDDEMYAIAGALFGVEGDLLKDDIGLLMARGQEAGLIVCTSKTTGSTNVTGEQFANNKLLANVTNCVNGGSNPLARVLAKWGLELYNEAGKSMLMLAGQYVYKVKDESGNYTGEEYNLSILPSSDAFSCSTWTALASGAISSPLVSQLHIPGGENSSARKKWIKEITPTEFVELVDNAIAINSGFTAASYHTRYPTEKVTFLDTLTGEERTATLVHNVTNGTIKGGDSHVSREEAYIIDIVLNDNGEEVEQLVKVQLSKDSSGNYYVSPDLYYKECNEYIGEDGAVYGQEKVNRNGKSVWVTRYKVIDGIRYATDADGNITYNNTRKDISVEDALGNVTDFYFMNGADALPGWETIATGV